MTVETSLSAALVKALAEIGSAAKASDNPFFKSKYADLGSIIAAIKPALAAHDLGFVQLCHPSETGVIVETVLHHTNGSTLSMGQLYVPANKLDAQGFGSAQTYARRYSLQTAFGVPAEDDDGNAASRPQAETTVTKPVTKPITDAQRDLIATLANGAGKSLQNICETYKIKALPELTERQGEAVIARLQTKQLEVAK